jgi:cytochrome P450
MVTAQELFSPEAIEDPYPVLRRLLAEAPVHLLPDQQLYVVLGFEAIRQVVADPQAYSSNLVALMAVQAGTAEVVDLGRADVLATADPPAHTAHRALVAGAFARPAVRELTQAIDDLLVPRATAMAVAGGGDWMAEVAVPVPVRVIAHLLALPAADHDRLARWSDDAITLVSGVATPELTDRAVTSVADFIGYLAERVELARQAPAGGLIDAIAVAAGDGRLTPDEAAVLLTQLVTAGAESTTSLLGAAVRMLAAQPAVQAALRADPTRAEALVEEALRLESPFRGHFRVTTRPVRLCGRELPAGARLMLLWGASNRDQDVFRDPEGFDLDRPGSKIHNSFGRGIHFCVGAHLARLEATRAIQALLDATSDIRLADTRHRHVPSLMIRRLQHLNLQLSPR